MIKREEILNLYYGGLNDRDEIAELLSVTREYVNSVIRYEIQNREAEFEKAVRAVNRKPEIARIRLNGKEMYDVTDLYLDRPCMY